MAVVNVYYLNTTATTPNWFGRVQDGGSAPAGATGAGWTVGKTAVTTPYFRGRFGATTLATAAQASSYIDSTSGPAQGTGSTGTTAGDSFRSDNPLNGTFAAGNWNFTFGMRTGTATTVGRIRLHVWASVNASGASARKLNTAAGTLIGTIVTMASATTTYNSTVTWAAPSVVLANEYLFTQIEWQETTAGTSNQCNAQFYQASFVTPDYVYDPATGTAAPTEAADTSEISGTVAWPPVTGTMDTLEVTDTLDFTGDVSFIDYLRPDGDASLGAWTDQADGTSNIWQAIDETTASDADYVQSPSIVVADTFNLLAAHTVQTLRDDYTGYVGAIVTPDYNMVVSKVGLICCTGNTGLHHVAIQDSKQYTFLADVYVDLTGGTPGQFYYTDITPITLAAGTSYLLRKDVTSGGGQNWEQEAAVTFRDAIGAIAYGGYNNHLAGTQAATASMFAGVDFIYSAAPIPPGSVPLTLHSVDTISLGTAPTGVWFTPPIGPAKPNRRVLICLEYPLSSGTNARNITIGGVAATVIGEFTGTHGGVGSFAGEMVWAYADVPTGTTADIDFEDGTTDGGGYITCMTYSFDKSLAAAAPVFVFNDNAAGTTSTISINTVAGAFTILACTWDLFTSMTETPVMTSSSETYIQDMSYILGGVQRKNQYYHVNNVSTLTPSIATIDWVTTCASNIVALTWPPATLGERTVEATPRAAADLKVRLFEGTTQIAEWTHLDVSTSYVNASQTLTGPQLAAIGNYANLFLELDDNRSNVYRAQLGNPGASVTAPVKLKYRYKKIDIGAFDDDTTAWVSAVIAAGGTVSAARKAIVDTFIKALKTYGIWDTLDRYWLLAAENPGAAGIDIRHLQPLTIAGAPSFIANDGYLSPGNSDYVNSNYNPALHAVNYTKNSATVGGQVQTVELTGGNIPAWGAANLDYDRIANFLPTANTNTFFSLNINTNNAYNDPAIVTRSSWVVTRNGPGANTSVYRNGVAQVTDVGNAATDVPDGFFIISGGSQGPYMGGSGVYRLASFYLASGWSSIRVGTFESAQNAMMTAIGCNVH